MYHASHPLQLLSLALKGLKLPIYFLATKTESNVTLVKLIKTPIYIHDLR